MDSIDSQRTGVRVTPRVPGSHPLHQLYPNLSGAILSEADLSGVNLSGANLSGANLSGPADVSGANLDQRDLCERAAMTRAGTWALRIHHFDSMTDDNK
jgi:hypothetical protein